MYIFFYLEIVQKSQRLQKFLLDSAWFLLFFVVCSRCSIIDSDHITNLWRMNFLCQESFLPRRILLLKFLSHVYSLWNAFPVRRPYFKGCFTLYWSLCGTVSYGAHWLFIQGRKTLQPVWNIYNQLWKTAVSVRYLRLLSNIVAPLEVKYWNYGRLENWSVKRK